MRRLTQEEVIERFRKTHGDKYDYSKVVYVNSKTKVCIICPKHGEKMVFPLDHIKGSGCNECGYEKLSSVLKNKPHFTARNYVFGVGIVDTEHVVKRLKSYDVWTGMLERCYSQKYQEREPAYKGCSVCDEWLLFSNFKKWFDNNYIKGYALDKDILVKGNKVYSPETCCFVPSDINLLLINRRNHRGEYPIGVTYRTKLRKYYAQINKNGKRKHIGYYDTIEEAFAAYKQAKEAHIKEVAKSYYDKGLITKRVYDALMRYEVEITD